MTSSANVPFPRVLTIAGSDSGGGAGIQADLKTMAALGAYGMSAITAITAQNTVGVQAVQPVSADMIRAQCASVFDDMCVDAVKIGMLPDVAAIAAVAEILRRYRPPFVVLDPVLVATSGDALALEDTVAALCKELMPLSDVITPNTRELALLSGQAESADEAVWLVQGRALCDGGAAAVLLKGGHRGGREARDCLLQPGVAPQFFTLPRLATAHTHGTGCTLSAAIAALYPLCGGLAQAVAGAKAYLHGALQAAQDWQLGQGSGPVDHQWRQRPI